MNNWYYYNPKPKIFVRYATKGVFECDICKKQKLIGDIVKSCVFRERFPQQDGDIVTKNTWLTHKMTKTSKMECPCEKGNLVFKGYPVYIEKIKKEGKVKQLGPFQMVEGRETTQDFHWFKTKKQQLNFAQRKGIK